jgi:hypothetical protein
MPGFFRGVLAGALSVGIGSEKGRGGDAVSAQREAPSGGHRGRTRRRHLLLGNNVIGRVCVWANHLW